MQPSQVICVYLLHYRLHLSVQSDVTATQKTHTHTEYWQWRESETSLYFNNLEHSHLCICLHINNFHVTARLTTEKLFLIYHWAAANDR